MKSNSNTAIRRDYDLNSEVTNHISDALKSIEAVLFQELSNTYRTIEQQSLNDIDSLRNIAQLQCALDIVQSAKTPEEKAEVYDILQHLKQPASG